MLRQEGSKKGKIQNPETEKRKEEKEHNSI